MENENKVKARVKLELEDLISFNKSLVYGKPSTKVFIAISIMLLIFSCFGIAAKFSGIDNIPSGIYFVFTLSFIYLFVFPILLKFSAKKTFRTNKVIQKPQDYEISGDEILVSTESGMEKIKSSEIYMVIETKRDFQFFIGSYHAYLIPKRCLENENEVQKLREIIKSSIQKSKLLS